MGQDEAAFKALVQEAGSNRRRQWVGKKIEGPSIMVSLSFRPRYAVLASKGRDEDELANANELRASTGIRKPLESGPGHHTLEVVATKARDW